MTEHEQLRAMNFDQRLAWHQKHAVYKHALGMWLIRVDNKIAAMGVEEEFDDMLAAFLMFIAREFPRSPAGCLSGRS